VAREPGIRAPGHLAAHLRHEQPVAAAEVLLRRSVEVGAIVAREGLEFGVLARTLAVGGQLLTLRGLAGEYDEVFLPLHGAHQAHNPAGARATAAAVQESFAFTRLVGVVGAMADKDVRGILEALEPVLAEVVVTQAATPRAMAADDLGALAVEVFGADRVEVSPRLDDALDSAVDLAEAEGDLGGAGILVTGSIVTVAQARTLLGAGS